MPHSGSVVSNHVECREDAIIRDPFELSREEDVFFLEDGDDQFSLEKDVIISTRKEESKPMSFAI